MAEYCHNCQCPGCLLITRAATLLEQRIERVHARAREREAEDRARKLTSVELFRRECAMVWMLINTASDQLQANMIIQWVAEALQLSLPQVNTRRSEYAARLTARAKHATTDNFLHNDRWAALPGTQGTDLPDNCEKCGGMKTEGRKCKRCDYKRSK